MKKNIPIITYLIAFLTSIIACTEHGITESKSPTLIGKWSRTDSGRIFKPDSTGSGIDTIKYIYTYELVICPKDSFVSNRYCEYFSKRGHTEKFLNTSGSGIWKVSGDTLTASATVYSQNSETFRSYTEKYFDRFSISDISLDLTPLNAIQVEYTTDSLEGGYPYTMSPISTQHYRRIK